MGDLVRSSVLESIGYLPPRAAEARYHRQAAEQAVTTWLTSAGLKPGAIPQLFGWLNDIDANLI
ncbi:MAG: hypothetical protein JSR94_01475 [Proteobacteria bacterium]|nr:hypothetical protein [Pseudomonadota bacterium]